jgi:hypothetical protein
MPDFDAVTRHIETASQELAALTRQLYAGQINVAQWQAAGASVLKDAHLSASAAARGISGMGSVEFGRVGGTLADEYRFLNGFAVDIANGSVSEAQALARINQYASASKQAYWREYTQMTARNEVVWWELNPGESCGDCMSLAAGSPYKPSDLTKFPGSGQTACRGNCNCTLRKAAA